MSSNQPTQPTKRTLLKTALAAGAAGLAGGYFTGERKGRHDTEGQYLQHSTQAYSCYGDHQAGITTPH